MALNELTTREGRGPLQLPATCPGAKWSRRVWAKSSKRGPSSSPYGDGVVGVADQLELYVDGVNYGNVRGNYPRPVRLSQGLLVGK